MIREYKIKIDDELLKGYTPIAFRIPEPNEHCVLQGGIAIFPAGERSVPRLILSPAEPEPKFEPGTYVNCIGTDCIYRVVATDGSHVRVEFPGMGGMMQPTYGRPEVFSPWVPQPGERVYVDGKSITGIERRGCVTFVGFESYQGEQCWHVASYPLGPGCVFHPQDCRPADFAPKPEPDGPAKQREGYEIIPTLRQHLLAAASKAAELAGALDTLAEAMAKDGAV